MGHWKNSCPEYRKKSRYPLKYILEGEDIVQAHHQVLPLVKGIVGKILINFQGKKEVTKEDTEDHLLLTAIQEVHQVQVHLPHPIEGKFPLNYSREKKARRRRKSDDVK